MSKGKRGLAFSEELIFEKSRKGAKGFSLPPLDVPKKNPSDLIDKKLLTL